MPFTLLYLPQRTETHGISGTFIRPRLFVGWDYPENLVADQDSAKKACATGAPMGTIQERAWSSPIWYTPDPKLVKKPVFYPGLQQLLR